jgi:hypothetical protein
MNKLILAGLACVLLAVSATSASAGEGLFCEGEGIDIHVPMAAGPGLIPLSAVIKAGGKTWTTTEGAADTIQIWPAQSASTDNRLYVDFTDANYAAIIVQIRLFWAEEETDPVYGGVLRIAEHGAWAISCGFG